MGKNVKIRLYSWSQGQENTDERLVRKQNVLSNKEGKIITYKQNAGITLDFWKDDSVERA